MSRSTPFGGTPEAPEQRQRAASFDEALTAKRILMENRPLLRRITSTVGINGYELTTGYIKAIRGDDGPALHIYPEYTGGFSSKGRAMEAAGDVER